MSSTAERDAEGEPHASLGRTLGLSLALLFLLANLAARLPALRSSGPEVLALAGIVVLSALACLVRRAWLGPALTAFGGSFFLYGFHSYSTRSQLFELALAALAVVLVLQVLRGSRAPAPPSLEFVFPWAALYALAATVSLLLLPPRVLEHRAFLEGAGLAGAVLSAFPKDPLYPIASVNRLWLFLVFVASLSLQPHASGLYRRLFRGIAWAVVAAVGLGILDFAGILPLGRYNLSPVFFGAGYRRLQSTFGNPSWFACFVVCALPFALLEWSEARHRLSRIVLGVLFPLAAAGLFLSGARASWLASLVMLAALGALRVAARRASLSLPEPGRRGKAVLVSSLAVFALLAGAAFWGADPALVGGASTAPDRFGGLSRELRIRGLGLSSPRRVTAAYAWALAQERPLLGLGYESYNMHLRAQLARAGSSVARVVNTAVAADPAESVFDDSHNTWLQVLVGTGALGLALWLTLAAAGLLVCGLAFTRSQEPAALALLLGMLVFHVYGFFQGMAYVPVIFFLFFLELGYAATFGVAVPPGLLRASRTALLACFGLVLVALPLQWQDRGYSSLKRALAVETYLPDEAAEFEGFYAPETGPEGEFRWTARRGIVNVARAWPFRITVTCAHPDLEREPVVVSLRYEGEDAGSLVCRRPGTQEKRFDPGAPGALRIEVSRTFRPEGKDRRELGVAVSVIRWE